MSGDHPTVELVSYHLPKTAGTSLHRSLTDAYGEAGVASIYDPETSAALTGGAAITLGPEVVVVHGHFRPHEAHADQFSNAQRMVWVRDPLERCWSLLRHWLKHRHGTLFERFAAAHMADGCDDPAELFGRLVADPSFDGAVNVYRSYLAGIDPTELDFIGRAERQDDDLAVLGVLLGRSLAGHRENVNATDAALPFERSTHLARFAPDLEFLASLGIDYR